MEIERVASRHRAAGDSGLAGLSAGSGEGPEGTKPAYGTEDQIVTNGCPGKGAGDLLMLPEQGPSWRDAKEVLADGNRDPSGRQRHQGGEANGVEVELPALGQGISPRVQVIGVGVFPDLDLTTQTSQVDKRLLRVQRGGDGAGDGLAPAKAPICQVEAVQGARTL